MIDPITGIDDGVDDDLTNEQVLELVEGAAEAAEEKDWEEGVRLVNEKGYTSINFEEYE